MGRCSKPTFLDGGRFQRECNFSKWVSNLEGALVNFEGAGTCRWQLGEKVVPLFIYVDFDDCVRVCAIAELGCIH